MLHTFASRPGWNEDIRAFVYEDIVLIMKIKHPDFSLLHDAHNCQDEAVPFTRPDTSCCWKSARSKGVLTARSVLSTAQ